MTEPFDLDAVLAETADTEPFPLVFEGETYQIPADDIDIRILAIAETGRFDTAMQLIVGDEVWEKMARSKHRIGVKACERLFNAYAQHVQGVTSGKSSGSTGS